MNTVAQVAERLQVSKQIVYALIEAKKIACYRIGIGRGTIRVSEEDLEHYLNSSKVEDKVSETKRNYELRHLGDSK